MTKGHKETFVGGRYVYHLGCDGGFMSANTCQNSSTWTLEDVPFIACLLNLNKAA